MADKGDELQRRALDAPRLTLPDLAERLNVSVHTLESYRLRRREMSPEARKRLSAFLKKHGDTLHEIAAELDQSSAP